MKKILRTGKSQITDGWNRQTLITIRLVIDSKPQRYLCQGREIDRPGFNRKLFSSPKLGGRNVEIRKEIIISNDN